MPRTCRRWKPCGVIAGVVAAVVMASACAGVDAPNLSAGTTVVSSPTTSVSGEPFRPQSNDFCGRLLELMQHRFSGGNEGDAAFDELMQIEPPAELAPLVEEERGIRDRGEEPAADMASRWSRAVEIACFPQAGEPTGRPEDRRFGLASSVEGLHLCQASHTFHVAQPDDPRSGAVLYGDPTLADPYGAPMIGIAWNPGPGNGFGGNGTTTRITLRGTDAAITPINVFQQVTPDGLGHVVTWSEKGLSIGLFGRYFGVDRHDELVGLASKLVVDDAGVRFPDGAPQGFRQVYQGTPSDLYFHFLDAAFGSTFALQYGVESTGMNRIFLSGRLESEEQFDASRFLTLATRRVDIRGKVGISGDAWKVGEGPGVFAWRESDGLVIRLFFLGTSPNAVDFTEFLGKEMREMNRADWVDLVRTAAADKCAIEAPPLPVPTPPPPG